MTTPDLDHHLLWGARSIGQAINRNPRQTFALLERRIIPARKVGKLWVASKRELLNALQRVAPADAA
jgi:hypothetical protein